MSRHLSANAIALTDAASLALAAFGVLVGVLGVGAAIGIPLAIEYLKRPALRIEIEPPRTTMPRTDGLMRIVGVRVLNEPIGGRLGKYLLRNTATGCTVMATCTPREPGAAVRTFKARWGLKRAPWRSLPDGRGPFVEVDPDAAQDGEVYDLPPTLTGADVGLAYKTLGGPTYCLDSASTISTASVGALAEWEEYKLEESEQYDILITVEAGGVVATRQLLLSDRGRSHTDLELTDPDLLAGKVVFSVRKPGFESP